MAIHGFHVIAIGPVSVAFGRALQRLASRGYADPACTVIKTANGPLSGITHAGGRYIHALNLSAASVVAEMGQQGIEPPPLPFVVAPGPLTLFHEWGHHVDRLWSRDEATVQFSFRWFSHFYELRLATKIDASNRAQGDRVASEHDAAVAAPSWCHQSSELFASVFEDWIGGKKSATIDCCAPDDLNLQPLMTYDPLRVELLPGLSPNNVREQTYALFDGGLDRARGLPPVREDLFGQHTSATIESLRVAMDQLRGAQ